MSAPAAATRSYRGIALCTTALCLLAAVAATVAFVKGGVVLGVVWVLLAGLSSNMAWYYGRRARRASGSVSGSVSGTASGGAPAGSAAAGSATTAE